VRIPENIDLRPQALCPEEDEEVDAEEDEEDAVV
jgi:hypothetical protein